MSFTEEILRKLEPFCGTWPVKIEYIVRFWGIEIIRMPFGGASGILIKKQNPILIILNSTDTWTRQRFTLAHELGHLLLGHQGIPLACGGRHSNIECEANRFAGRLLMPEILLHEYIAEHRNWTAEKIASAFEVSPAAVYWRLQYFEGGSSL